MEIHDGSLAQDLTRAFQCVDQRLTSLEGKPREPAQGHTDQNPATFDAGQFTVSVRAATRQSDALFLGIQIYNKAAEPIFLAFGEGVLIDEDIGVPINFWGTNGIATAMIGYQGQDDQRNYTLVPSNTILNFTLRYEAAQIKSNNLSLALKFFSVKNRQIQRIVAPISVALKR